MSGKGSFFKGWSSTLPNQNFNQHATGNLLQVFVGHVLDVFYEGPDAGKIRVKLLQLDRKEDKDITRVAFPVDMNSVKYPLPGETVFLLQGVGVDTNKDRFISQLYYVNTITNNSSITFNSNPYISTQEGSNTIESVATPSYETRFERKLTNPESYKRGSQTKERQPLLPFEGDFILQSRFGSTIRLGSTGVNEKQNPWSKNGGVSGNPITIISANRSIGHDHKVEDVDRDDSSIYLCTSQVIPITLSTSKDLKTYRHIYDIPLGDSITTTKDVTSFIETPEEEIQHYNELSGAGSSTSEYDDVSTNEGVSVILQQISDDSLDHIPGTFLDNKKRKLELVQVDGYALEKNTAKAYLAMKKDAKKVGGINIQITSGFRPAWENLAVKSTKGVFVSATSQATLRRENLRSSYTGTVDPNDPSLKQSTYFEPPTAPPGASNHGNGIAVDLNVSSRKHFNRVLNESAYQWLIQNAHKYGFVRTVSSEEWHFEFQPDLAAKGPYGGISQALRDQKSRNGLLFYSDLNLDTLS